MEHYDYIFTGAGCAGLSLLARLITQDDLRDKKVLVIDRSDKKENDRTWCYWEKGEGYFESLVYRQWNRLSVYGNDYAQTHDADPYRYKMIRGIDLYEYCLGLAESHKNIEFLQEEILEVGNNDGKAYVTTSQSTYSASYIFNSIIFDQPVLKPGEYYLLQHFKGFVISSKTKSFDPKVATLMDFRVSQKEGTSFVYVLPFSETEALVEYTLFTKELLAQLTYDKAIHDYLRQILRVNDYDVVTTEFGVIPMTNYRFPTHEGRIINIGTAGGKTKPSTGYTFSFIQKQADSIVRLLSSGRFPVSKRSFRQRKFHWYDSTLLNVLANNKLPGSFVFTELFKKNKIADVFRFLDNESTLVQDLKVISALPKWVFASSAVGKR